MKNEKDENIPSAKTPRPLKAFRKLTTTISLIISTLSTFHTTESLNHNTL